MALARCVKCSPPRANKPPDYHAHPFDPVGFPDTALVCGTKGCESVPKVWLKADEAAQYARGQRIFEIPTQAAKIRVV